MWMTTEEDNANRAYNYKLSSLCETTSMMGQPLTYIKRYQCNIILHYNCKSVFKLQINDYNDINNYNFMAFISFIVAPISNNMPPVTRFQQISLC